MINRRNFIKTLSALGISLPVMGGNVARSNPAAKKNNPVIICSRDENWGRKVLKPGWDILSSKGSLLDAVEKSANITELDPEDTSVGYGGLPNERGVVQLDASIMYGPTHNCGSVAALEGIKTPCSVARLVMERTDHIHIVGKGAQEFAVAHGFKVENLLTEKSRKIWLQWKENVSDKGIYAVSVRGSSSCKIHLGRLVSSVSAKFGGSGGGHDRACGAVIPKNNIKKFLREMNLQLGSM